LQAAVHSALDLPPPIRDFAATRRVLLLVFVASVLIPLSCLAAYGYFDYQVRLENANDVVERLARVADEQAVKVMDLNKTMAREIVELLGQSDERQIVEHESELHRRLEDIGGNFPQVAAISVFGADGRLLVSSRLSPVPDVSIAGREDFHSARAIRPDTYFSLPMRGAVAGTDVFNTTLARTTSDGRFLGVVSVALRRSYFSDFYRELVDDDAALTIGLYRRDISILVRYPAVAPYVVPGTKTPLAVAFRENKRSGVIRMLTTVDGSEKLFAFRRVADYPLYVASGYKTAAIFQQWLHHYLIIVVITSFPCLAVCLLVLFSLRRLEAERLAWESWQGEVAMRMSAEASSRQLRRMGALGNLVANVAHDFNNLLMVVTANMQLARNKKFNNVEREVMAVEKATTGAETLARRLMSVARKQPLRQAPVELWTWLPAVAGIIQSAVSEEVDLSISVMPDVWRVMVDATELEFAIINIAVNAKDAMSAGGQFVVHCENVRLAGDDDGDLSAGDYVVIALSDNGTGMTGEVAEHAFEPLFTTKAQGAGTGLGLAQVLAMCEQAGGAARLESFLNKGTTVRIILPRYQGAVATPLASLPENEHRGSPAASSVLLVEDNEDVAAGLAAVLEVFGCTVRHELTADRAFEVLNEGSTFDLVLSDIQMPGKRTGIDLAELVRKLWPAQRIALMTGYADELDRAKHVGVRVLSKPFNIADLQELLMTAAH
jgi:signal transduction histidine kinase